MQNAIRRLMEQTCMIQYLSEELDAKAKRVGPQLRMEYHGLAVMLANSCIVFDEIGNLLSQLEEEAKKAA